MTQIQYYWPSNRTLTMSRSHESTNTVKHDSAFLSAPRSWCYAVTVLAASFGQHGREVLAFPPMREPSTGSNPPTTFVASAEWAVLDENSQVAGLTETDGTQQWVLCAEKGTSLLVRLDLSELSEVEATAVHLSLFAINNATGWLSVSSPHAAGTLSEVSFQVLDSHEFLLGCHVANPFVLRVFLLSSN